MSMSASSRMRYNRLMGINQRADSARSMLPTAAGPTMVKIKDPIEEAEDIVARLMDADPEGRKINKILARRKNQRCAVDEKGEVVVFGRSCCTRLAKQMDQRLARLHLPHTCVCPECGTIYSIEMRTREERRHV